MKRRFTALPFILLLVLLQSCNLGTTKPTLNPAEIQTLSAQTVMAIQMQTLLAQQGNPPAQSGQTPPALTLQPSPTQTLMPTNTNMPTVTPYPTITPTITPTPIPCNWVQFISDVTIPDNWTTSPNDHFIKTWRLKNIGSCTWTSGYSLVFDHGDRMEAPDSVPVTSGTVAPGQTVDVSVNLKSPGSIGTYQGYFKLRGPDYNIFGIGPNQNNPFWVKIKVGLPDLIISNYSQIPGVPDWGQDIHVKIKIKNQGSFGAGAFSVYWYAKIANPAPNCTWNIPSLGPGGETNDLECTWGGYSLWTFTATIKVVVDPGLAVTETDDGNNTFTKEINIG